jgi:hypothetical protein
MIQPVPGDTYKVDKRVVTVLKCDQFDVLIMFNETGNSVWVSKKYFLNHYTKISSADTSGERKVRLYPSGVYEVQETPKALHEQYFNTRPHECPCGISKVDCSYHAPTF